MNTYRKTSVTLGVLLIIALVSSMLSGTFSGSKNNPDYLSSVSANENKVLIAVLLQLTLTGSVVAIPIVMFPILKKYDERLALGYVGSRIFEGFFDAVMAISLLLLLTLSREFVEAGAPVASHYQTSGTLLLAVYDWSSVPENFPYGLGALILNYVFYQSKLIPRWLSGWGLVGSTLMLAMGLLRMFSYSVIYLALPIVLNEMVLAVWLIIKGFNSSAIGSESVRTARD